MNSNLNYNYNYKQQYQKNYNEQKQYLQPLNPLEWFSQSFNNNNYYNQKKQQTYQSMQQNNIYPKKETNNNFQIKKNQDIKSINNNQILIQTLKPTLFTLAPIFQTTSLFQSINNVQNSKLFLPSKPLINIPDPEDVEKAVNLFYIIKIIIYLLKFINKKKNVI